MNQKTNNLSISNINNINQANFKVCKNVDIYFIKNSNIKGTKDISKKDTILLKMRKLESFNFNYNKKELQVNNFEIKFLNNKIKDNNINLYNSKQNNLLIITKNKQFKIINKYSEKNQKMNIIENGIKNGKDIIYNNFETNENYNKQLTRNNNIKNNKYNKNNEENKNLGNDGYLKNLLIFITIILIVAFILNYINI